MSSSTTGEVTRAEHARLGRYAREVNLKPVVAALRQGRDLTMARWLESVRNQPFHMGRPARAVSDHIPALLDCIAAALERLTPDRPSLDDPCTKEVALKHAQARVAQGLLPSEIVVEFRILREELLETLSEQLDETAAPDDLFGAQMLIGARLDTVIADAIAYFMSALERAKDDFVAIAAHDLRNPLTPLKGATQLALRQLASGKPDPVALARHLEIVTGAVVRIEQLINNLLDVTRVQAGRLEVKGATVDLAALVNRVVARQSEEARTRTVVTVSGGGLQGTWEESRIEQVVENLLSNALKYAPEGPISIHIAREDDDAVLTVADQGIGLSAEDRAQLFRRFYRSPEVIDRKLEGTGLGLFIARGIVQAHSGELEALSEGPGRGTTMRMMLPLTPPVE